jgi:hypothetical protein
MKKAYYLWSGQRDLNSRLQAWEACTLPLSYARTIKDQTIIKKNPCQSFSSIFVTASKNVKRHDNFDVLMKLAVYKKAEKAS